MKIDLFSPTRTLTRTATITSLLTISSFLSIDKARAFTVTLNNTDFETGDLTNWNSTGDAAASGTFTTVAPFPNDINNNFQGVITTACSGSASAECVGTSGLPESRNDDNPATTGAYNVSTTSEPVSASVEISTLQNFLGLSAGSLQIAREGGTIAAAEPTATRTPKEGSAITQTFTADEGFILSFNWNYLTNDGQSERFGDQDFAFFTIYQTGSDINTREITVLEDSNSLTNIGTAPDGTEYLTEGAYAPYTYSQALPAGEYTIGYGVVDVDGTDRSSALLIDEISVQEVPFEFSPTLGLLIVGGMIGCDRLRRQFQSNYIK